MKKWYNDGKSEYLLEEGEYELNQGRLRVIKKVDILKERISKEELYRYYILDNHKFTEVLEKYQISPKGLLNKLLKEYKIHKDPKAARKNNRYIGSHEYYIERGKKSSGDILEKQRNTVRKNREKREQLTCRTLAEQKIYDELKKIYQNVQYDKYVDERYPYYVDFYIPEEDLFIEYQGYPSHGKIPYDKDNSESLEVCYKLYGK